MVLRGRRLTVALVALLAVLLLGGTVSAMAIGSSSRDDAGTGTTTPASSATGPAGPTGPSSDTTVLMAPAAQQHARAGEVRALLQSYFDAINGHDYAAWATTVSTEQSDARPRAEWERSYSTTTDSSIKALDIDDDPFRVRLWFTSEQDPQFAPDDMPVDCINWDVTYLLVDQNGRLVIAGLDGSTTSKATCA